MEVSGYIFKKKFFGNIMKYVMMIQNVIDLYFYCKVFKYRDCFDKVFIIFVCNFKGGGFKIVFIVLLFYVFWVYFQFLFEDLCILVIDFDLQVFLIMFLSYENLVGLVENMVVQVMFQNVFCEELFFDFIVLLIILGVDVIFVFIDDVFFVEGWKGLCEEYLSG